MLKKISDFYSKQDDINKSLIIVIAVQFVVFIILSAGFLLGSIIADLNFKMLEKQMDYILNAGRPTSKRKGIANMMIRSLLYLTGLIIAGSLAYFKIDIFNVIAVFVAYLIPKLCIYVLGARKVK